MLEIYGSDAFATKARAKKLGKDGLPRLIRDVTAPLKSREAVVDVSQDDAETTGDAEAAGDSDDEGSGSHYHYRDGEGEQANPCLLHPTTGTASTFDGNVDAS